MLSKNQIREIQSLHLKKRRDQQRRFIAEGVKSVLEIASGRPGCIEEVFGTGDFFMQHQTALHNIHFTQISEEELQKISLQSSPNAVLAVCRYFEESAVELDFSTHFTFYLDEIRDPGNFGTIVRLADWFGIPAVFCSASSCDLYNPKVIQASMGAFLRVNVVYCTLPELLERSNIAHVYGAVLNGRNIYQEQLQNGLIVIGNEANGISEANLKLISAPLTIPAAGSHGAESLNAAMASSIIVSEFFRQLSQP